MATSIADVDLGPGEARRFDRGSENWAILLPGAGYSTDAPLLWYAREVALAADRNVLAIRDRFDRERDDPKRWVEERAAAALTHLASRDDQPVLVAKSLTSLAAPLAAERGLPAVWLTPLINPNGSSVARDVAEALAAATAPALLIGGTADPTWDGEVARSLPGADVLELPDADHLLQVPLDPIRSLAALRTVVERMATFLDAISARPRAEGGR